MKPSTRGKVARRVHAVIGAVALLSAWIAPMGDDAYRWVARVALLVLAASALAIPGSLKRLRGSSALAAGR